MKKILLLVLAVIIGSILLWNYAKTDEVIKIVTKKVEEQTHQIDLQKKKVEYIFIPYWSFTKTIVTDSENSLIYFGLGANENGIETQDQGYTKMATFLKLTPNARERILAIRMTDKNINARVLKSLSSQEKIASEAVTIASENGFDGVLLDYETSAFGFDSTTKNITSFYRLFSDKTKQAGLAFSVSLYGDTYFRARPYDVKSIGELSDKVLIMTYDFSKSRGNPGPNFPLIDDGKYGYDLSKMTDAFQKDVDNKKLIVTLGYFGYDWRIDREGVAVAGGVPLSTNEIENEFVKECEYDSCTMNRSKATDEPSIEYVDENGESHIIWFEDTLSANKKIEFLKNKGILEIASWAYSYY